MPDPLTIMTPLKNTNKHLSDYLPPALVKDWRQCFRSRSSLLIFILMELAGWLLLYSSAGEKCDVYLGRQYQMEQLGLQLYFLGFAALAFAIPYRAGLTVAADTKVRSSNFLMLTPLSARRIVWGTWSSTALIVLLAALCALPLLFVRRAMMGAGILPILFDGAACDWAGLATDCRILAWFVLCGWVMTAFFMFSVGLPRILRLGLFVGCVAACFDLMLSPGALARLFATTAGQPAMPPVVLYLADVVLLIVLLLELARRHYAAPAENCSRSVRLLAFVSLALYVLQLLLNHYGYPFFAREQAGFALFYLFAALLVDALLPTYAMPPHAYRFWRWLPAWFQKPGVASSSLCLALVTPLFALPRLVELVSLYGQEPQLYPKLLELAACVLNAGFGLLLWLLITDCLSSRSGTGRPVVFCLVALVVSFIGICLRLPLDAGSNWANILPLAGVAISVHEWNPAAMTEQLTMACLSNGAAFLTTLLLLLLWRGRVKKP